MKMKKGKIFPIIAIFLSLMITTAACQQAKSPANETSQGTQAAAVNTEQTTEGDQGLKVFTTAKLAKYNGKDGNPAYIAVDGKVYDVTNVPEWKGGVHQNRFEAGKDLTEEITKLSPHGKSKLELVPIVGTLAK